MNRTPSNDRNSAVDILRGLAILGMIYSGSIAFGGVLPAWMYHAQIPPPHHVFDATVPGITWVDLVFPLFLFIMGVSMPLSVKTQQNSRQWVFKSFQRATLIAFIGIFFQHFKPHLMTDKPETIHYILAILAFIFLFLILTRWDIKNNTVALFIPWVGMIGGVVLILLIYWFLPTAPDFYRSDIILIVLANMALFGGLIWWFTRNAQWMRWGIILILIGIRLAHNLPGPAQDIWNFSPLPWLYRLSYLQYLIIVLFGTFIGEWVLAKNLKKEASTLNVAIALLLFSVSVLVLYAMFSREVYLGFILTLVFLAGVILLVKFQLREDFVSPLLMAFVLLLVGFLIEPFEGGIKKDPGTLSYYFTTTGLSILLFVSLILSLGSSFSKSFWRPVRLAGMNPLVAYVAPALLIFPILNIFRADLGIFNQSLLLGMVKGLLITIPAMLLAAFLTYKNWLWKT